MASQPEALHTPMNCTTELRHPKPGRQTLGRGRRMPKHWILLWNIHFLCDLILVICLRKHKRSVTQQTSNPSILNPTLVCLMTVGSLFFNTMTVMKRKENTHVKL